MKSKKVLNMTVLVFVFTCLMVFSSFGLFPKEREITISAVGDCLIANKVSHFTDPRFLELVEILRSADCTWGNCETTLFNAGEGFPAYKTGDPNVYCEPWGADEFKWLGIDLMSAANNHIMDFDYDGLFATLKHLDRVGIKYAGAGKDLDHAAKPGFFETPAGPVALISFSSWVPEKNHQASLPHPYMKGRPGLNPINTEFVIQLDDQLFFRQLGLRNDTMKKLGFPIPKNEQGKDLKEFRFGDMKVIKGDKTELVLTPEQRDLDRIIEMIKVAKRNSRIVIATIHEHIGREKQKFPTRFQEDFARSCIDAGADMFIGTGAHEIWGIEIYKGKPIFYSVGNFFFQVPLRIISPAAYQSVGLPADTKDPTLYEEKFAEYFKGMPVWESFVPFITFDSENKLKEIILYPITLGENEPLYRRGTPRLADKNEAKTIMDRLIRISKPYKTTINSQKGIWKVVL
jgi:poly-gamma-glutamate capsule biosynthesis protein CapA/YwtB (metallophosphatase superfamily)